MKFRLIIPLISCVSIFLPATRAMAIMPPERPPLPNFERRSPPGEAGAVGASAEQKAAAEQLRSRLPEAQVEFDPVTGSPKWISAREEFLSGTNGAGKTVSTAAATTYAGDPYGPVKAFLSEHNRLFGYGPEILEQARVKREFQGAHNGLKTVVWEEQVAGLPVFEAVLIAHVSARGELVNISSQFVPDPQGAAERGVGQPEALVAAPPVSAARAVGISARNVGEQTPESEIVTTPADADIAAEGAGQRLFFKAPGLSGSSEAKLVWLPISRERMRLCWQVVLTSRTRGEMFLILVDAQSGEALLRHCLTDYISDVSYRVYTSDSPSPFSPGLATPANTQPALVARVLVTTPALDTNASPSGWIDDGGNETRGNNVDAHTDRDANNSPDLPRPQGSPFRVFDPSMNLTQDPTNYSQAAVVQLFYLCNWMHDRLYQLGFTEAAGNFQSNNFGRGGLGNDAVQADAQDGSGVNNANFSTPADGSPGRMQMYLFSGPSPRRDGDFDAEVVLHEYTHGLSNRRVGGGVGISALQPGGMGEGWSDFYGLSLLSEAGDNVNGNYAAGGYVTYQFSGLTQNYYYGIRRYPYSTDMTKNPLTFKDIDPGQASSHAGVPRSPVIGTTANEVHNMGEVWCVTLWEARARLITKYGWELGNQRMLQIVTDGMNLSPANPTFLQARDAIIQADAVDYGGTNRNELWAAFAKRGMGFGATSPVSSTATGVHESYDLPDTLRATPPVGMLSSGVIGGPFNPSCQTYALYNAGTSNLVWTAVATAPWVSVSSAGGALPAGVTNNVDVCLTAAANSLTVGIYSANILFSNANTGVTQTRTVSLEVTPPRVLFFSLDTNPGWSRSGEWAFGKPTGRGGTNHGWPDPTNGVTGTNVFGINLNGDYSVATNLPTSYLTAGPFNFGGYTGMKLQFQRRLNSDYPPYVYATVELSTNGTTWSPIFTNVSSTEIADTAWSRFSYNIPAADNRTNVFVRWTHRIGQSGAYAYSGWNLDDIEFLGNPSQTIKLTLPTSASEGAGSVSGTVSATPAPTTNLLVTLNSSDTSEATTPPNVTILAGQTNATFNLAIIDDTELDGAQTATITASAPGYAPSTANISVLDNETAVLQVALPTTATEGQGSVQGTVHVTAVPSANITVNLSSSDTTAIQVPASVLIPAGQTSAVFTASIVDDSAIDGPQNATVTAHVQNWTDGAATIAVLDNESLNLTVTLPPSANEDNGIMISASWLSIGGSLTTNLVVSLTSDAPGRMNIPASVTFAPGQTSNSFDLMLIDNSNQDGNQTVTVTASAPGFNNGVSSLLVVDDDVAPVILTQPSSQSVVTSFTANFNVGASGKQPFSYQWRKGGVPIAGATSSAFSIFNVQSNDAGRYSVKISNLYGFARSADAILTVSTNAGVVAYFSDNEPLTTAPESSITQAGFVALQITDIANQGLTNFNLLLLNETDNNVISSDLLARLPEIQAWVTNGGKLIVHDRSAGNFTTNPFLLGTPGTGTLRFTTSDLDVIPPATNLVVAGPFGTIDNTTLDGGSSSAHGYLPANLLPAFSSSILSIGGDPNSVVSFSYPLGKGSVFYSTIPLDCYLAGADCTNNPIAIPLQTIYTPNVLVYSSKPIGPGARPKLVAERNGNLLLLKWPVQSIGYVLESTPSLSPQVWIRYPSGPVQIGDQFVTSILMSDPRTFYRLRFAP